MKKLIVCCFALAAMVSCNKNQETTSETTVTDSTAVAAAPADTASAEFKPFNVITIKHSVQDYAKWRPLFDSDSVARNEAGMKLITVSRGIDKPNDINLAFEIADVQKAKDFAANPRLKAVMEKGGVNSAPTIDYVNVIRFDKEAMAQKDYIEVTHKVKDFNAWLKVFDAEGPAKRAEEGMKDMVLARDINNPNTVNLVFTITDMAKAKAAINSEAKKKLMTEAGVVGKPRILFYHMTE
jgi:quinol monooxygenase YgiN